tara:strand:- start:5926 stop:6570 length:645 start_codon:yes stop_codon:yes gene_type:complete
VNKSITVNDFLTEAQEHSKGKVCTKCKEHKSLSEFSKQIDGKNGLRPYCRYCAKVYNENACPFKNWFASKKGRTKFAGKEFTIEPTDIPGVKIKRFKGEYARWPEMWEAIEYPKVCPVLGIKLSWKGKGNGGQDNSPSLDRIDSTKGYIPGNVMIMSSLANRMKSNSTLEQKKIEARYYLFGSKLMGVEANTNKTEYVHPLVEHKAGHTRYFGD